MQFSNEDVRGILVDRAFIERSPITRTRDEAVQLARKVGDGTNVYGQEPLYKAFTRCAAVIYAFTRTFKFNQALLFDVSLLTARAHRR